MTAGTSEPDSDFSIRLGQFLQVIGLTDTGGEAKQAIAAGEVQVNGEAETRRGRQLHAGDVVRIGGQSVTVDPDELR